MTRSAIPFCPVGGTTCRCGILIIRMNSDIKTSSEISGILQSRFGLTASIQVIHPQGENRTLYELAHIQLDKRMTITGLERLCRRIAKALNADLYGSINIDFVSLGDFQTFDLLLEVLHG